MNILERFESVAHNVVRTSPVVFDHASGTQLFDEKGNRYIDFHIAGGSLSYGHNDPAVRAALIGYLSGDHVLQTRDRTSVAKRRFVNEFVTRILHPRELNYKILFTDPGNGTAAEVALRLARRHKKRSSVIAFTNSDHGTTEGALSVTSRNPSHFESLDLRSNTVFMPFHNYFGDGANTVEYLRRYLGNSSSGLSLPAAAIVEPMQVNGGVHMASSEWLRNLHTLCQEFGILLIVDETQTGCGRLGPYFAFERAGLKPDMVIVSNAVAAGLPMSILLLRPELDHWRPGEQVGVFQGDALSFIAATELVSQWRDTISDGVAIRSAILESMLHNLVARFQHRHTKLRGSGMIWGLEFDRPGAAAVVSAWALERGVIVEPARIRDEVLLIQPPLMIEESILREGLGRLCEAVSMLLGHA